MESQIGRWRSSSVGRFVWIDFKNIPKNHNEICRLLGHPPPGFSTHSASASTKMASQSPLGQLPTGPNLSWAKAWQSSNTNRLSSEVIWSTTRNTATNWTLSMVNTPSFQLITTGVEPLAASHYPLSRCLANRRSASRSLPEPAPRSIKRHFGWVLIIQSPESQDWQLEIGMETFPPSR